MQAVERCPGQVSAANSGHRRRVSGAPGIGQPRPVHLDALGLAKLEAFADDRAAPVHDRSEHIEHQRLYAFHTAIVACEASSGSTHLAPSAGWSRRSLGISFRSITLWFAGVRFNRMIAVLSANTGAQAGSTARLARNAFSQIEDQEKKIALNAYWSRSRPHRLSSLSGC